jgi:hypothetical protein
MNSTSATRPSRRGPSCRSTTRRGARASDSCLSKRPSCAICGRHHYPNQDCQFGQIRWKLDGCYQREQYLYNYARARSTSAPFVFLVEGAPDVLRLAEAGHTGVALMGEEASTTHLEMLAALGKPVWVAFDNDTAGREARDRLRKRMLRCGVTFPGNPFYVPEPFKDLGEMDASLIRAEVTGQSLGPEELALLG